MMVGSGVVAKVCTAKNFRGTCKKFTNSVVELTAEGIGYSAINSYEIYTLNPKKWVSASDITANQVRVCSSRRGGGGRRKLDVGVYDFNRRSGYRHIRVGANVKEQAYSDRSFYGDFEVYNGGSNQAAVSTIKSIRVMSSSDELMATKVRPISAPIPDSTPSPTVDNSPVAQAKREKVYILNGSGTKCLTVKGGSVKNYTPIVLANCVDADRQKWTFTSDNRIRGLANMCLTNSSGSIVLETCGSSGSQYWEVSDNNELKRAWACLSEAKLKNGSSGTADCNGKSEQKWRFRKSTLVVNRRNSGTGNRPRVNHAPPTYNYKLLCRRKRAKCCTSILRVSFIEKTLTLLFFRTTRLLGHW